MSSLRHALILGVVLLAPALSVVAHPSVQPYFGARLAYVSAGKLYVGFPKAKLVPSPGLAREPAFSYDGQWLAFNRQTTAGESQLWLARAGGTGAHRVTSIGQVAEFKWSPSADVLAVQPAATKATPPIALVNVQGRAHVVPDHLSGSFLWSADGRTLVIAEARELDGGRLYMVHDNTVSSYAIPGTDRLHSVNLLGLWPNAHSILYWISQGCESCVADGKQLLDFHLKTRIVHHLGISLAYSDWIDIAGNHLLVVKGGARSAFYGKHVHLCVADQPCSALPGSARGKVSLDPTWGPGGGQIVFVVAPAWNVSGFMSGRLYQKWLQSHALWVAEPDGSHASRVDAGVPNGVQNPEWTRDGRGILFVKDGALWIDSHLGAANAQPIARLVPAGSVPNSQNPDYQGWYYGHMDWHDLFAFY